MLWLRRACKTRLDHIFCSGKRPPRDADTHRSLSVVKEATTLMNTELHSDEIHYPHYSTRMHQDSAQCAYTSQWPHYDTTSGTVGLHIEPRGPRQDPSLDEQYAFLESNLGVIGRSARAGITTDDFSMDARLILDSPGELLGNVGPTHMPEFSPYHHIHQENWEYNFVPSFGESLGQISPTKSSPARTWTEQVVPHAPIGAEDFIDTIQTSDLIKLDDNKDLLYPQTSTTSLPWTRFACPFGCRSTFGRPSEYRRHMTKHTGRHFKCEFVDCSKSFFRRDKLRDHMRQAHKSHITSRDTLPRDSQPKASTTSKPSQDLLHTCTDCNLHFETMGQLKSHKISEHKLLFECECGKVFKLRADLVRHESTVHKAPEERNDFPCPKPGCLSMFARRDNLSRHLKQCQGKVAANKPPQPLAIRPAPPEPMSTYQIPDPAIYTPVYDHRVIQDPG